MIHGRSFRLLMVAALITGPVDVSHAGGGEQANVVELTLPRPAAEGEAVWLEIQVGALLPRGASIGVRSSEGELLATVAPYGTARGARASAYLVPLPRSAIVDGRIRARLTVEEPGKPGRAPRADEVESVVAKYVPVTNQ